MNRKIVLFMLAAIVAPLTAQSPVSFTVQPGVALPIALDGEVLYKTGFAAHINVDYRFSVDSPLLLLGTVGYTLAPTLADESLHLIPVGVGTGLDLSFGTIADLRVSADLGWYVLLKSERIGGNPYARGLLDITFNISPEFSIGLGGSFSFFSTVLNGNLRGLYTGAEAFLSANMRPVAEVRPARIEFDNIEFYPVFPVFHKYYSSHELGTFSLQNSESKPIHDVEVSFFVSQYMDAPSRCIRLDTLNANERIDVPLYALFSMDIMDITEATMSSAVISVDYTWQETKMAFETAESIRIQNRNAMIWDDDRKAAAFVTVGDPFVLQFAKGIAGPVREASVSPIHLNFRIAMGVFEGMRDHGINYVIDPRTPYIDYSENVFAVDYLQFPRHTLLYRAGDCDDLTTLYCSLLGSVGIETAFITVPGHIFMAFNLEMSRDEARRTFKSSGDFIYVDDTSWVPIEITEVTNGFLTAWQTGAKYWREHEPDGTARFYPVKEAQTIYEPVGLRPDSTEISYPLTDMVYASYESALTRFVTREIRDEVERYQLAIERSDGRPRDVNRLGVLYVRYGLYDKAREQFEKLVGQDPFFPAIVNLGNIAYLMDDMKSAVDWFARAARHDPDNVSLIAGLARVHYELENYGKVSELYDRLKRLDEDAADQYAYLVAYEDDGNRAAAETFIDMLWVE